MARVSTYLNFARETEQAFEFYKSVFKTEYEGQLTRMGEAPTDPNQPPLSEEDKNLVMHVALPILGGHVLMGTDAPESMNFKIKMGNNVYIMLEPDTRKEVDDFFDALSAGGEIEMEPQLMFWGDYYASCRDKFGVQWMFNTSSEA